MSRNKKFQERNKMKTISVILAIMILMFSGCGSQGAMPAESQGASAQTESTEAREETEMPSESVTDTETMPVEESSTEREESVEMTDTMRLLIGEKEVPVTWEDNASVDALRTLCPLTIQMSMYGGFEQVGALEQSIVRDDKQTATNCGDIVLYSGNQIVIFYGSNSWAYTKLGHVELSQQDMRDLLGGGDVSITLQ